MNTTRSINTTAVEKQDIRHYSSDAQMYLALEQLLRRSEGRLTVTSKANSQESHLTGTPWNIVGCDVPCRHIGGVCGEPRAPRLCLAD